MIKITNGINVFEVTKGAYDGIYSRQGYKPVIEKKEKVSKKEVEQSNETTDEVVDEFAELKEKPIGQWNKEEVKEFAAANDIDISGTKNVTEAKELIKEFLEQ